MRDYWEKYIFCSFELAAGCWLLGTAEGCWSMSFWIPRLNVEVGLKLVALKVKTKDLLYLALIPLMTYVNYFELPCC